MWCVDLAVNHAWLFSQDKKLHTSVFPVIKKSPGIHRAIEMCFTISVIRQTDEISVCNTALVLSPQD